METFKFKQNPAPAGTRFNIVGPTGALSATLMHHAHIHGVESLPLLSITAGICIAIVFALNLDRYIMFIPSAVVHGFTCGVCCS